MVDEKNIPKGNLKKNSDGSDTVDESNVDQINNFVTSEESNENSAEDVKEEFHEEAPDNLDVEESNNEDTKSEVEEKPAIKPKAESREKKEKKETNNKPKTHPVKPIANHKKNVEHNKPKQNGSKHSNGKQHQNHTRKPVVKTIQSKPEHKKADNKNKSNNSKTKTLILWIGIGVLAIILVVALILMSKNTSKDVATQMNNTNTSVAATVNGEPIYLQSVMSEYEKLSPVLKQVYTIEYVLNKSIDDILLNQEAINSGIKVTDEEVDSELNNIKKTNMMSDTELETALKNQGLTLDDAKNIIKRSLYIRKLLNATILQDVEVTDEEIKKYYDENTKSFEVPEKVTVQHILVMISDTITDEQAKTKIDQINSELIADNFCDLVKKYSEDPGSVSNCGKYTFAKGEFNNPEFENPSFSMKIGEKTIVKTVFGYHLIKKLETLPAGTQKLSEVSEDIKKILHDNNAQIKFDELLAKLRSEAVIVNYLNKEVASSSPEATEVTSISGDTNLDVFAKCLTSKGAKFYGASWCPHCNNQKELFGNSLKYIAYVECAVDGQPQVQTKECTDADISGYPTWIVNGEKYPGEQTLDRLAKLTGCSLN